MAALSLAGLGAYLGVLYALGEFRKPELGFFLDTMNPVMLLRYVNSEVREKGDGKY